MSHLPEVGRSGALKGFLEKRPSASGVKMKLQMRAHPSLTVKSTYVDIIPSASASARAFRIAE
jgi:hypothetical protein